MPKDAHDQASLYGAIAFLSSTASVAMATITPSWRRPNVGADVPSLIPFIWPVP